MGWARHSGTAVSLALLASVIGHFAVHRHFQRLAQARQVVSASPDFSFGIPIQGPPPAAIPRCLDDPDFAPASAMILPALQTSEVEAADGAPRAEAGAPQPVPLPNDASPLGDQEGQPKAKDSIAVRMVIEDELKGSSREERDIWYEELKSLPAGVVRDLLQVRKQLRQLPRELHKTEPAEPVAAPRLAELPAEPASQVRRQAMPDWSPAVNALEQACAIARHNLANATTPGFKRLRVTLVDAYGPWHGDASGGLNPVAQVEGCRLAPTLLDMDEATMENTSRQLDLAIQGKGLFVARKDDKLVYTRCGAFELDDQRRICLVSDAKVVLEPVVTIPVDAMEIQVTGDGKILALRTAMGEPEFTGQIQLARFPCPSRLRPEGGTLLVATQESGAAETGAPGEQNWGSIQQAFLELSNVDPEAELSQVEKWQSLLKSLPTVSRSVTAGSQDLRSH